MYNLTMPELKAFIALSFYMGLKKQPNSKTYWMKVGSIFHCPTILNIMTCDCFQALRRCLHLTNQAEYVHDPTLPGYDKIGQVRWLVDEIREACKKAYRLGKCICIDEMMVQYKGKYCPLRQYMPKKLEKWGIKIWCLASSVTKCVYNFFIYCSKVEPVCDTGVIQSEPNGETLAHAVVLNLLEGLHDVGHIVVMDNYFISIGLFKELLSKGFGATWTICSNCVGLLEASIEENQGIQ